ncbi:hypothetical protein [Phaeodactylibacter sp.]|uniref:hypothetical protein n=1 Tax=Phaeodactylibacter sp. TaxID=1940289 RepID=UPI0025E064BF|nr:hypothetical protein [Phaeodactylibacter sp.]MCI4649825.1 hypothetical protein [Phaeodactylibacter sp.]MCI5092241.1 hypothetical protein [Phaeodactylibacter sp.]
MKKSILFTLATLLWASLSYSQKSLSGGIRMQFNMPVSSFNTGTGNGGAIWVNKEISKRSNLSLSIGYQYYAGLGTGFIEDSERIGPTQVVSTVETAVLDALSFLTLDGTYHLNTAASPWSFSLGFRLAKRIQFKGESALLAENRATFLEPGFPSSNNVDIISNHVNSGASITDRVDKLEKQLSPVDAGLQIGVQYQLIKGLTAEAGFYQGMLNQWSPEFKGENGYWITSFLMGLSARIF